MTRNRPYIITIMSSAVMYRCWTYTLYRCFMLKRSTSPVVIDCDGRPPPPPHSEREAVTLAIALSNSVLQHYFCILHASRSLLYTIDHGLIRTPYGISEARRSVQLAGIYPPASSKSAQIKRLLQVSLLVYHGC